MDVDNSDNGSSSPAAQEKETNSYEQMRQHNIIRNSLVLNNLGLGQPHQQAKVTKRSINDVDKPAARPTLLHKNRAKIVAPINTARNSNEKLYSDGAQTAATFSVGQLVWAQHEKYGTIWWPATVTHLNRNDYFSICWDQADGTETSSEIHVSKLRERPVCKCGDCKAESLIDEDALLQHNAKVSNCIDFETQKIQFKEVQMAGSRYGRESRDFI
jgi:hypothetical protein